MLPLETSGFRLVFEIAMAISFFFKCKYKTEKKPNSSIIAAQSWIENDETK